MSLTLADIQAHANLSGDEMTALLALPEARLRDLAQLVSSDHDMGLRAIQAYKSSAEDAEANGWDVFLKVVNVIVTIAGIVAPIASAAQAVLGVVGAAKAL